MFEKVMFIQFYRIKVAQQKDEKRSVR